MFDFLKYTKPSWYYRLAYKSTGNLLVDFRKLNQNNILINPDNSFKTDIAKILDAAYTAHISGIIPNHSNSLDKKDIRVITDISDNYRFISKHFPLHLLVYTYLIRIITLHNPFKETLYFIQSLCTTRLDQVKEFNYVNDIPNANITQEINESKANQPHVSVVIPTLDRYQYLSDVLQDLQKQDFKTFEVIICDQSNPIDQDFYSQWNLEIKLIEQEEKALWLARNTCVTLARGKYIALTEDDVRLPVDWLSNHLRCINAFNADASCGIYYPQGAQPTLAQKAFKLSDQFPTGNTLIKKDVFKVTGLFDRQFEKQRMGDGEFGLRCVLNGMKLIANPLAYCIDVKAPTGGLRQMGGWDAFHPKKILSPRPIPSALYYIRKYFGNSSAIHYILINIPNAYTPYKWKKVVAAKMIFMILTPIISPLIIVNAYSAWIKSSKKINQGAQIPNL